MNDETANEVAGMNDISNVGSDRIADPISPQNDDLNSMSDEELEAELSSINARMAGAPTWQEKAYRPLEDMSDDELKSELSEINKRQQKVISDRLELSDKLEKMASFVADETDGDESYKADHDFAVSARDALANHKTNFANLSDEQVKILYDDIDKRYQAASKRRGHLQTAWDALKRGHSSIMNMLVQGIEVMKPGEMSQEDADIVRGAQENSKEAEILAPKKIGGIENISSVGDAADYVLETVGENLERMAIGAAGATVGAIAAPAIGIGAGAGAMILGGASTLLGNTGEAVSDQLEENRGDGDIRNSRAYAIAQGIGYSILDGAFGVNKFAGKIWGSLLRRAGLKGATKGASVEATKSMYEKATLKGIAKEIGKEAILGEGLQEMAQSQGVGRGVRYFQTGSVFRKKDDGTYESVGDAFLEAANEFAGGATAGLTFGLLGGASAHLDARRASRISHETNAMLKDEKLYQDLPEYAKLLVDRHLQNDRFLATTELVSPEVLASLEQSNVDIDNEIRELSKSGTDEEKLAAQSARAYLDIFKSQYSLEGLDEIFGVDEKTGEFLSRDGGRYVSNVDPAAMLDHGEEHDGVVVYTNPVPGSEISVGEMVGADGRPTGKYMVQNDPHYKTPVGGEGDFVFDSRDKAFEAARRLDAYNRWREDKLKAKANIAYQVFEKLFGNRGVNLKFVDRPTEGSYSVGTTTAAFVPNPSDGKGPRVELSLDSIQSLGALYTTLVHERSHEDIVEFLLKSKNFYRKVGDKVVPDWEAIEKARVELMAKVQDENGQTAEDVSKKFRDKSGKATTEWGKSAGIAGEEMVAERNSVFELAKRLRDMERGAIGSVIDKVRQAIGLRMAYEMGVDPSAIMPKDVSEEMNKIFDLGYVGEAAPAEFQRETPEWNGQPVDKKATKRSQLRKTVGPQVAQTANGEGEVTFGTVSDEGTPAAKPRNLKPQMKAGDGASYANNANIQRADGTVFTKVGTSDGSYAWKNLDNNELANDETATQGGFSEVYNEASPETNENGPVGAPGEEGAAAPAVEAKPAEAKEAAPEAKETPAKPKEEPKAAPKAEEAPIDYTGWEKNHAKDVVDIIRGMPEGEKKEELKKAAYYGTPDASLKSMIGEENPQKKSAPKAKKAKEQEVWTKKQPTKVVSKTETTTPTAEKKSEVAAPSQSDEKAPTSAPKETETTSRPEAAKPVQATETRSAAKEEAEPVRVNPDEDTLTIGQNKAKEPKKSEKSEKPQGSEEMTVSGDNLNVAVGAEQRRINESIDETVDNIATFVNDAQRQAVKEHSEEFGEPEDFIESKDGVVEVVFNNGNIHFFLGKDGSRLTRDEVHELFAKKTDLRRGKTIVPLLTKLNAMSGTRLTEVLNRGAAKELKMASQLSDNRVLKMAVQDGNMLALRVLLDRWTRPTKARPSGAIQDWLKDKGVADADVGKWLDRTRKAFRKFLGESAVLEAWKESAEKSEKTIAEIKDNLRKNGVRYDEIGDLNPQKGTPLGRTVSANAFLYGVLNLMWANEESAGLKTVEQFDAERSEQIRQILEKEKESRRLQKEIDENMADKLHIPVEEYRRNRVAAQTVKVAKEYEDFVKAKSGKDMSDEEFADEKRVLGRCVSQDGKEPDENARRAVLVKASEIISRVADGYLATYKINNPSNVADVNGYVLDLINEQWKKGRSARTALWNGESTSKGNSIEAFVRSAAKNRAKQLYDKYSKGPSSLDAAIPGNEYGSDDENGAATLEELIAADESSKEEQEYRRQRGMFATAEDAVDAIIDTGVLPQFQSDVLRYLINAWKQRVSDAWDDLVSSRKSEASQRRITTLERAYRNSKKLDAESVVSDAAESMGLRESVYRGNLFGIFDDIEKAMAGEEIHFARKYDAFMPRNYWAKSARLSKGMFTAEDVTDNLSGLYENAVFPLNYSVDNLIFAMRANGDAMMAKAVEMANEGKTNKEIFDAFDKESGEFAKLKNAHSDAESANQSLEEAYKRYGWIDIRAFGKNNDRADRVRMFQNIIRAYAGGEGFDANRMADYERAAKVASAWLGGNEVDIYGNYGAKSSSALVEDDYETVKRLMDENDGKRSDVKDILKKSDPLRADDMMANYDALNGVLKDLAAAVRKNATEDARTEKGRAYRQGVKADHATIGQMLKDAGNDEAAVRKALADAGNDEKRIESMFTHWRLTEKRLVAQEKARVEREAKRAAGILEGLADEQKKAVDAALEEGGNDIDYALNSLEENGWSEKDLKRARNYYDYKLQTTPQTNEEVVAAMTFGQKAELVKSMLAQTGDAYMTDNEVRNEAVEKYRMPVASVNMLIRNARPKATSATEADLAERTKRIEESGSTLGAIPAEKAEKISKRMDLEDAAEARKVIADAEKRLVTLEKNKDYQRVKERLDAGMKNEEIRPSLRREGISQKREDEIIDNYSDVKVKVDAAKGELAKAKERLANIEKRKDESASGTRRSKTVVATFDVNYGATNEDVTVSATSVKALINKAIRSACNGQWFRYDRVEITPKSIDGRPVSNFGIITADDSRDPKRTAALSKAFGFEGSGEVPEAGVAVHGNAATGGRASGVAGTNRRGGSAENRGPDVRGDGSGQAVSQADWYARTGVEQPPDDLESGEAANLRRNKTMAGLSDTDYAFAARRSREAHGYGTERLPRKTREVLESQARDLLEKDPLLIDLGRRIDNGEPPSAVDVHAIRLLDGKLKNAALYGHLSADEMEANEKNLEHLARMANKAGSEAGRALGAFRFGINIRTLDSDVYQLEKVRAKFEKEVEERYGVGTIQEHLKEVEDRLTEFRDRNKEMSSNMMTLHDNLEKALAENEELKKNARSNATDEYYRGVKQGRAEAEKKLVEETKSFAKKYAGKIADGDAQFMVGAIGFFKDKHGIRKSYAGNPKVSGLDDDTRDMLAVIYNGSRKDIEVAKEIIRNELGSAAPEVISQLEAFVAETEKKAVSPNGTVEQKKRVARENIGKRAEKAKKKIADEREKAKDYEGRLLNKIVDNEVRSQQADTEEEKLSALGEFARNWFKLSVIRKFDEAKEDKINALVDEMNRVYGGNRFDFEDAEDALLGLGAFKPMSRNDTKIALDKLIGAKNLLKDGKVDEAKKNLNMHLLSDAEILEELDRRIGSLLNTKLNRLEERVEANDENTAGLRKEIHDLIMALHDIRSGKPIAELLDKYTSLAVGMKDYRKQRTMLEQIESRIAMYERKLSEDDFESVPKVETPDDSEELKKVYVAKSRLEKARERYKKERAAWKLDKGPWLKRFVGSIIEMLGEVKAVAGSMDLSAVLRQGGQMTLAHPIMAYQSFRKTLKAFKSKEKADEIMEEIWNRPNAKYYIDAEMDLTEFGDNSTNREDRFILNQYRLITRNKFMKWGIDASERAFVVYLNLMRANVFDAIVANSPLRTASAFSKNQLKAVGNFVNVISQRGMIDQTEKVGKALELLNAVLWSPRNLISRFQFLWETGKMALPGTEYYGISGDMMMRKMFAKEIGRYALGVAATIFFAKMMADLLRDDDEPPTEVVTDPKSSDYMKVKVGNTRLDFLSGLQQVVVFISRMATGEKTQGNGNTVKKDRGEMAFRFARTKFSPMAGIIYDLFTGENFDKKDISWRPSDQLTEDKDIIGVTRYAATSMFFPLIVEDVIKEFKNNPAMVPAAFVLSALGAGVNTYDAGTYKAMKQDYQYFKRLWKAAETKEERDRLELYHPMLKNAGAIDDRIKAVNHLENELRKAEKAKRSQADIEKLKNLVETRRRQVLSLMSGQKKPMQVE